MFKNVASQKLMVFAFDSATNLPKTGDAANLTAYVSKDYGTVTALGDTSATEMDSTNAKGYYLFDLTQAESNADTLMFSAKSSTSGVVVIGAPAVVFTNPPNFTLASIDGNGRFDLSKIAGTSQTSRDIGASVLLSSGTGTGQVKLASGYIAPNWGDVGNPTTTVNLSATSVNLTTSERASIPDYVWDALIANHPNSGSTGEALGLASDHSGLATSSALTAIDGKIDTIDDFLDTEVAAIKAKTDNLPSDPADASDISTAFSGVNTKLDTIDDFLDTEVAAIKTKTDQLTFSPAGFVDANLMEVNDNGGLTGDGVTPVEKA